MKILKPNKTLRILFTGGGSGGHVYPLVSVLKEMQKFIPDFDKQGIDMEYYYIGSNDFTLDLIKNEKINIFPLNIKKTDKNIFKKFINIFVNF
jgi:UDP-N-acetylglucosamine:LPS N-acetylglucosamine transferase